MGISQSLPTTGYIKMIDIWMTFTMSYPFVVITLHCLEKIADDRGTRRINVKRKDTGKTFNELKTPSHTMQWQCLPIFLGEMRFADGKAAVLKSFILR